ncbi:MAG: ABC transporter permease [Desulfovibrionaceae bacterium]|nr:ABC transporter permease [Desulfovibrionaceae bacterium]
MISLSGRDILHSWGKFVFTGLGLGLLIGVTLSMAGIYRGMIDDAMVLLDNSGADLWVVQQDTLGPYAESSTVHDDVYRSIQGMEGVARAVNVTYLTMQVRHGERDVRSMVVGVVPGGPGEPGQPSFLIAGRHLTRGHYEAVADVKSRFRLGDRIRIRRDEYTVVGLTRRMVSSGGDPMIFISLKDAQDAQFLKDNDFILRERRRAASQAEGRSVAAADLVRTSNSNVNAVLVRLSPGHDPQTVARTIQRWTRMQVFTRAQMEQIMMVKVIATSSRQIGMFLVILSIVSAAIVAFIIYTLTMGKIREIAVLKLIGAKDKTIAGMILQQALGLGGIGFVVGKIAATLWAPIFPKYVLLLPGDAARGFVVIMVICAASSVMAIHAALKVDPAEAIGG